MKPKEEPTNKKSREDAKGKSISITTRSCHTDNPNPYKISPDEKRGKEKGIEGSKNNCHEPEEMDVLRCPSLDSHKHRFGVVEFFGNLRHDGRGKLKGV